MAAAADVQKPGIWATFRDSPAAAKTIMVGVIINRLSGFLTIFLVLYLTSRGYSTADAVFALGAYGAGGVVGTLVGGELSDRFGPRNATAISMGVSGVLIGFLLVPASFLVIVGIAALVGLSAQIFRPASTTLLSDLTPGDNQVMIFAIWRFGLNVGVAAAPLLGYAFYDLDHHRYTLVFLVQAAAALGYAIAAWILLPAKAEARAMTKAVNKTPETTTSARGGYLAVLRNRRYAVFLVVVLIHTVVYQQYVSTLPLTVNATHLPIFWYTLAVSVNGVIVIALELPATKIMQKLPMRLPIAIGLTLVGVGVAIYGLPLVPLVIIGGTLVWTFGEIVSAPSLFAYPALVGAGPLKGRYIGSFQFAFGLGNTLAPLIGGSLFLATGASSVWPLLGAVEVLVALSILVLVRQPGTTPEPEAVAPVVEIDESQAEAGTA